jgi:hypothetical protein
MHVGLEVSAEESFNCKLVQSIRHCCDVLHKLIAMILLTINEENTHEVRSKSTGLNSLYGN